MGGTAEHRRKSNLENALDAFPWADEPLLITLTYPEPRTPEQDARDRSALRRRLDRRCGKCPGLWRRDFHGVIVLRWHLLYATDSADGGREIGEWLNRTWPEIVGDAPPVLVRLAAEKLLLYSEKQERGGQHFKTHTGWMTRRHSVDVYNKELVPTNEAWSVFMDDRFAFNSTDLRTCDSWNRARWKKRPSRHEEEPAQADDDSLMALLAEVEKRDEARDLSGHSGIASKILDHTSTTLDFDKLMGEQR